MVVSAMLGGERPYVARYTASPRSPIPLRARWLVANRAGRTTCEVLDSRRWVYAASACRFPRCSQRIVTAYMALGCA
jgi:hypothetical protein